MARGLAGRPPACAEHPHRAAADRCDECGRAFCGACLVRGRPQLLCRHCWAQAPEREARAARARHPLYRRLDAMRERRASVVAGGVIIGVLALLGASSAAQVLTPAYRAQVGEAVSAVRRGAPVPAGAAGGGGQAAPAATRIPTLIPPSFGSASTVAELAPGTNAAALTDGRFGPAAPAWRSPDGFTTAELRFPPRQTATANRALFANSAATPPDTWAKDVEVWLSPAPNGADAVLVGRWTLAQTTETQTFSFAPAPFASVRLRILSNHASGEYVSLAEFALLRGA